MKYLMMLPSKTERCELHYDLSYWNSTITVNQSKTILRDNPLETAPSETIPPPTESTPGDNPQP